MASFKKSWPLLFALVCYCSSYSALSAPFSSPKVLSLPSWNEFVYYAGPLWDSGFSFVSGYINGFSVASPFAPLYCTLSGSQLFLAQLNLYNEYYFQGQNSLAMSDTIYDNSMDLQQNCNLFDSAMVSTPVLVFYKELAQLLTPLNWY